MSDSGRGILVVISGFSGVGKGTVVRRLMDRYPDRYRLSISATTRSPRDGEQDGVHYFFVGRDRFEKMIEDGLLLEYALFVDNYYGTPRGYVEEQLAQGYDVILEIEQQGAFKVRGSSPHTPLIFVAPPSAAELERRLRGRKTETEDVIMSRLARAAEEAESIDKYDYYVVNDDADVCAEEIHDIIETERRRIYCNSKNIQRIQADLSVYRRTPRA